MNEIILQCARCLRVAVNHIIMSLPITNHKRLCMTNSVQLEIRYPG